MSTRLAEPQTDGDPVLLTRVRAGDADAYAELFERHRSAALAFARSLAGANHADDLVAEAFARVLDTLQRDLGPTVSFRSYLLTSIRSLWANTVRSETRYDLVEDFATIPSLDALTFSDDPDARFDNRAIAAAYKSLPERWQAVLWYTAVEGLSHSDVAQHLGIKPNAVAALSFRAREGLRQAYLAQHLVEISDAVCRAMVELLPAYARGSLDKRKRPTLEGHLQECRPCTVALADLDDVNNRLGAVLLPIVLGAGATQIGWPTPASSTGKAALAGLGVVKGAAVALLSSAAVAGAIGVPLLYTADHPRSDRGDAPATIAPPLPVAPQGPVRLSPQRPEDSRATVATAETFFENPSTPAAAPATAEAEKPTAGLVPPAEPTTPPPPATPTSPDPSPTPSPPAAISPDAGVSGVTLTRISLAGQSVSKISVVLSNLHNGSVVRVEVTNLVGFPVLLTTDWSCPGAGGGLPTGGLFLSTTRIGCTYTGADVEDGLLELAAFTSGSSSVTATITTPEGVVDPDPSNNTATATINP